MYNTILKALDEEYSFIRQLSKTSDMEILLYEHKDLHQKIVVKKFEGNPEVYVRLKNIRQVNIPNVYDAAEEHGNCIVLEEYIDGIIMSDILEERLYKGPEMAAVILQLLAALEILHKNNIIHRDIKPENIMFDQNGTLKLIDYSAAKIHRTRNLADTINLGTNGYAAPEQYGITQSDNRTDVFAVGILMNVMLTGEHPSKKLYKGACSRIINKCIQVSLEERYQNVNQLRRALMKKYSFAKLS